MEYRTPEYDYDQQPEFENPKRNSEMGLKIAIIILLVVLAAVSFLYYKSVRVSEADAQALKIQMDTLQNQTQRLMGDMDVIKFDNDTLNRNLQSKRHEVDSLMSRMKTERSISYSKLKQYEREIGTLRVATQGFVRQIDSLNRLNQKLVGENIRIKKDISELRMKTEVAEETASELNQKIKRGALVKVSRISVAALAKNNKEARNAKTTERLVVSFDLTANDLAEPGERNVYVRIVSPEGFDLQEAQSATFDFDGQRTPYSAVRSVDYQGDSLPVSVYYNGSGLTAGKYTIYVYMDGMMLGTTTTILK